MDIMLLGACESTHTHTKKGVCVGGGGHYKSEWCDVRGMRKREEKERRDIRSKRRGNVGGIAESLSVVFFNLVVVWGGFAHGSLV